MLAAGILTAQRRSTTEHRQTTLKPRPRQGRRNPPNVEDEAGKEREKSKSEPPRTGTAVSVRAWKIGIGNSHRVVCTEEKWENNSKFS